jgi:hypothetical protein
MILPPAVTVHGLPHALAALAPGRPVTLLSAPNAAVYAGVGWWRAVVAAAGSPPDILDCGAAAGRVLEALRAGQCRMVVRVGDAVFAELAVLAGPKGAVLLRAPPPSLDLGRPGAVRHLAAWLSPHD